MMKSRSGSKVIGASISRAIVDELIGVMQRVQIRPADTARLDGHQDVARAGYGVGDVFDDEHTSTGNSGTHRGDTNGPRPVPDPREPNRGFAGLEVKGSKKPLVDGEERAWP